MLEEKDMKVQQLMSKKKSVDTKIYCENEMKHKKIKTVWNWMKVTSFIFSYSCKYSHLRAFNFFFLFLPILLAFILLYLFKKRKSFGKGTLMKKIFFLLLCNFLFNLWFQVAINSLEKSENFLEKEKFL